MTDCCEHCSDIWCYIKCEKGGGVVLSRGGTGFLNRTLLHRFG